RPSRSRRIERGVFARAALRCHEAARAQIQQRILVDDVARPLQERLRMGGAGWPAPVLELDQLPVVLDAIVERRMRSEEEGLALLLLAELLFQVGEQL